MRIRLSFLRQIARSGFLPTWLIKTGAVIIAIPLILVCGIAFLAAGVAWQNGEGLESVLGGAFIGVVCGGLAFWIVRTASGVQEEVDRRERHKDKPWMMRSEWADGTIQDGSRSSLWFLGIVAVVWNALAWPFAMPMLRSVFQGGLGLNPRLLMLLFPAVGLWLAGRLVVGLLERHKYGNSVFEMDPFPGQIGGRVQGLVKMDMKEGDAPAEGFEVRLGCYRREVYYRNDTDGDGNKDRRARLDKKWGTSAKVQPQTDANGRLVVPIDFSVPPGMEDSAPTLRQERILWRLDVTADVPGIDYESQFEIPVFNTGETEQTNRGIERDAENGTGAVFGAARETEEKSLNENASRPAGTNALDRQTEHKPQRLETQKDEKKPWTYRKSWSEGRIRCSAEEATSNLWASLFIGLGGTATGLAIMYYTYQGGVTQKLLLIGVPFLLIGIGLLVKFVIEVLRRRRYDDAAFVMDEVPGALGGAIRGTVTTGMKADEAPEDGFKVQLSCYKRSMRRDSEGRKQKDLDLLWRNEKRIRSRSVGTEEAAQFPVFFELPDDQPASTPVKKPNRILWRLDVEADVPGVDYAAYMEVPVFDVPERRTTREQDGQREDDVFWGLDGEGPEKASRLEREEMTSGSQNPYADHEVKERFTEPTSKGITMERTPSGGLKFYFGAARRWGAALLMTFLFFALLGGLTVMVYGGINSILAWLFVPIFTLLLGFGAFRAWTYASSIRIEGGKLTVIEGPFGRGSPESISYAALSEVAVASTGETSGILSNNETTYEIRLVRKGGDAKAENNSDKATEFLEGMGANLDDAAQQRMTRAQKQSNNVIVGRNLTNRTEADWIADKIQAQVDEETHWE